MLPATTDEHWMREALALAERAERELDEVPVGAVLVGPDGQRLADGLNRLAFAAQSRLGDGYEAVYYTAPTRAVAEVRAESYAARKENADTNSILTALK